jgi:Rod binding domain-containing protein
MNVTSSIPLLDAGAALTPDKTPNKLTGAARQFEALMIGELLKSAEGEKSTWLSDDADDASETAMDMARTQFAQAIAAHSGFGLANSIERAMTKSASAMPSTDTTNSSTK